MLFTLEFVFLFFAIERTTAASAVVFLFTAPFFVAARRGRRSCRRSGWRPRQWLGVALAFVGVALGFYRPRRVELVGDALALAAGAAWGATTLLIKATRLKAMRSHARRCSIRSSWRPLLRRRWRWGWASLFRSRPSAVAVAALLYQGVLVVGVTYLIWFWLLKRYRAPELSALTFISPVVGVLEGWLALGETPTSGVSAGARRRRRRHRAAELAGAAVRFRPA